MIDEAMLRMLVDGMLDCTLVGQTEAEELSRQAGAPRWHNHCDSDAGYTSVPGSVSGLHTRGG